jgi:hypothetical protein
LSTLVYKGSINNLRLNQVKKGRNAPYGGRVYTRVQVVNVVQLDKIKV